MSLGIIEIAEGTTGSGSSNYSYISSSTNYWWPIGSNETTSVGGALFAGGDPVDTVITSYFGCGSKYSCCYNCITSCFGYWVIGCSYS